MALKKDVVLRAFNELLIDKKFDYLFKGVPPHVLQMRVAHEITLRTGESDYMKVQSKSKELIKEEVKKETLVILDGNYSAGPKSGKNDDNSNDADQDQDDPEEYEDEEDEEDEDYGEVKRGEDSDYSPNYVAGRRLPQRRGEGRVSARQKKSRFDSEDYVFPNKLKNFMKRTSPGTSPNKVKVPRKRPGPKPRNRQPPTTCSICRNPKAEEEITVSCKNCPAKAHESCTVKELKGKWTTEWCCFHCTPRPNAKWKCAVCGNGPGKDLGVVVSCENCASQYHKQCHSPPIPATRKPLNSWRCSSCPPVQRSKSPVPTKRLPEASASSSATSRPSEALSSSSATKRPSEASASSATKCPSEASASSATKRPSVATTSSAARRPSEVSAASADDSAELEDVPAQKPDIEPAHKKLPDVDVCDRCDEGFPNLVDRLICGACQSKFHSRCCRVRNVDSLLKLGSRRDRWKCDSCVKIPAKFLNGTVCYKCKREFPNSNDKATCSNCKLSFHARCCRAKEVANLTRLGSRKAKWRCDACKFPKGRNPKKQSEEVSDDEVVPNTAVDAMEVDVEDEAEIVQPVDDNKYAWWQSRLRPIVLGPNEPALGPIPDFRVPDIGPWAPAHVQEYFDDFFEDPKIGLVFVEHDIDGKALKLMRRNDIISTFETAGIALEIILEIILHIKRLQLRVNDRRYIWADTM